MGEALVRYVPKEVRSWREAGVANLMIFLYSLGSQAYVGVGGAEQPVLRDREVREGSNRLVVVIEEALNADGTA